MKYKFVNDRTTSLKVHSASDVQDRSEILPRAEVIVEIPEGTYPFIKVWDDVVLLTYGEGELI